MVFVVKYKKEKETMKREYSEQDKVYIINALKQSHTDIHRALHQLLNNGSERQATIHCTDAIKKIATALARL